jgi:hypothetical protein
MANLIRSSKLGSDWTANELFAYNITVTTKSPQEFFCPNDETLLAGLDSSHDTFQYLTNLELATNASQESLIDNFSRETLRLLGLAEPS